MKKNLKRGEKAEAKKMLPQALERESPKSASEKNASAGTGNRGQKSASGVQVLPGIDTPVS